MSATLIHINMSSSGIPLMEDYVLTSPDPEVNSTFAVSAPRFRPYNVNLVAALTLTLVLR